MAYLRKRPRPSDLRIALLHWEGYSNKDIATILGKSPSAVSAALAQEDIQGLFKELRDGAVDTMLDVKSVAQAIAPVVMEEKIRLALNAPDARIRSTNCKDLLEMAGHKPVERISVERPDKIMADYKGKTEQEIRDEILKGIMPAPAPEQTLH